MNIKNKKFRKNFLNFFILVNIIAISNGAFTGWPSASFLVLQADDSPLKTGPMSNTEAGWVGSVLCIGGLIGNIFFAWFTDKIGRKRCLLLIAIPSFVSLWHRQTHISSVKSNTFFLKNLSSGDIRPEAIR